MPALEDGFNEGERKLVTILFADIRGSLALIERLDPEQAQQILDAVTTTLGQAVHRFGGTVSQNLGDGIMALFGAPCAVEDHADRACLAALAMVEDVRALQIDGCSAGQIQLSIGISSGEVVVGPFKSDLVKHYSAVGATTHIAARLQQRAETGRPLLTAVTRDLLKGSFALRSLGPQPLHGLSEPLELIELLGHAPGRPPLLRRMRRGCAPFVGRKIELALLLTEAEHASAGSGRLILLSGEPGIGKSRLAHEFLLQEPVASWRRAVAWTSVLGPVTPWQPVAALLRSLFSLNEGSDAEAACTALRVALTEIDPKLASLAVPLTACLGLVPPDVSWAGLDPSLRRERMRKSLLDLLRRLTAEKPLVLLIEDVHEADHETLAFLDLLTNEIGTIRLLVVITARPSFTPAWLINLRTRHIALEPLDRESSAHLLRPLTGAQPISELLCARLVERAGGNPFFLEELAHGIGEWLGTAAPGKMSDAASAEPTHLPSSIRMLLSARIDRLDGGCRRILRAASVLGDPIVPDLLVHLVEGLERDITAALEALCQDGFLTADRHGSRYRFRHALIREAAYGGLLKRQARALHRRAVDAVRECPTALNSGEGLAALAYHALHAELWSVAFSAYREVAERALIRSAARDGLSAVRKAAQALDKLEEAAERPQDRLELLFTEIEARFSAGEHGRLIEPIARALGLAETIKDDRRRVRALTLAALQHWLRGEMHAAVAASSKARQLAGDLGELDLEVNTGTRLGMFLIARGDYEAACRTLRRVAETIPEARYGDRFGLGALPAATARAALARALVELAAFDEAKHWAREAARIAERYDHPFTRLYVAQEIGLCLLRAGETDEAVRVLVEGCRIAQDLPRSLLRAAAEAELGAAYLELGRLEDGLRLTQEAVDYGRSIGLIPQHAQQLSYLARAHLLMGDIEQAERLAEEAIGLAERHEERGDAAWIRYLLGAVREQRSANEARKAYTVAWHEAQQLGLKALADRCEAAIRRLYPDVMPISVVADVRKLTAGERQSVFH